MGRSDASDDSQRFRNLDILVFRPRSTPLALHPRSRERAQLATPSDLARSRVLRGGVRQDASETIRLYSFLGQIAIEDFQ